METHVVPGVFGEVAGLVLPCTLLITFDGGPGTVLTKGLFVELFCGLGVNGLAQKEEEGKGNQIRQVTKQDEK